MLDEYKQNYTAQADLISNWKGLSRNELCRKYKEIERGSNNSILLNQYISAIILSFWHILTKTYNRQPVKVLSEEDCYECLITTIMDELELEPWEDETQSVYHDERGPERVINNKFQQNIVNLYVAEQRQKRRTLINSISLDAELDNDSEETSTLFNFISYADTDVFNSLFWKDKVRDYFVKQEFITAFILDIILTQPGIVVLKDSQYEINTSKIAKILNTELDDIYSSTFSFVYDIDKRLVDNSFKFLYNIDKQYIDKLVRILANNLRAERGVLFGYE